MHLARQTSNLETVVRSAVAPLVEPDSTVLASTIDTKQVVNLPVTGRSVMSLAFLVPGWSSARVTAGESAPSLRFAAND